MGPALKLLAAIFPEVLGCTGVCDWLCSVVGGACMLLASLAAITAYLGFAIGRELRLLTR